MKENNFEMPLSGMTHLPQPLRAMNELKFYVSDMVFQKE